MKGLLVCLIVCFVASHAKEEQIPHEEYYSNEMLTTEYAKQHLSRVITSNTGRKVYVFDDAISPSLLTTNRMYFSANDNWRYVLFDKFVIDSKGKFDGGNGIPWKSWQNPTLFSSTRLGLIIKNLVQTAAQESNDAEAKSKDFKLTEIYSAISRRGDLPQLYSNSNSSATNVVSYSSITFTNLLWLKNNYGEILFYENDDNMDIFAAITPRFGRTVVWESAIPYILRPPSITVLAGQYSIFTQFDSEPDAIYNKRKYFFNFLEDLKDSYFHDFVCIEEDNKEQKIDLDKHLTLRRHSKNGDFVAVFDNLFEKEDLDKLRTHSVKYGKYFYDDSLDISSDNVQWIAGFHVDNFVKSKFWPVIKQMAEYVTGSNTWYPYDVACNLIRSADHTRFHLDTSDDYELETTFLLYLSPNWTAENYGETAFMELNHDSPENDYVAEVVPMYGRAVIFNGSFPHSAHPPAPMYGGPRYTFAVKLSHTKRVALIKTHHEESRHSLFGVRDTIQSIQQNPALHTANQKISTLVSYLHTKAVQKELNYINDQEFQDPAKEKDEDEEEPEDISEEDIMLLEQIVGEEFIGELSPGNLKTAVRMVKDYKVPEMLKKQEENHASNPVDFSAVVSNVTEDSRANLMKMWDKICKDDDSCVQDFLLLFLRQHFKLREENIKALFTAL